MSTPTGTLKSQYTLKLKIQSKIEDGSIKEKMETSTKCVAIPDGVKPEHLAPDLTLNLAESYPDYIKQFNVTRKIGYYSINGSRHTSWATDTVIAAKLVKNKKAKIIDLFK